MADTDIDWAEKVWNPTTGCDKVSEGCDKCYAMRLAPRLKAMELKRIELMVLDKSQAKYQNDGDPRTSGPGFLATEHEFALDAPLQYAVGYRWFINSMSDLFHKLISTAFIAKVLARVAATPHHTYQLLTKRPGRMQVLLSSRRFRELVWKELQELPIAEGVLDAVLAAGWPLRNLWIGVSVENQRWADVRIPKLVDTPAAVRFLSCEPLVGPIDLRTKIGPHCPWCGCHVAAVVNDEWREDEPRWLERNPVRCPECGGVGGPEDWCPPRGGGIDWVIVGGESGGGARPMELEWAKQIQLHSEVAGVPYFFKQAGTVLAGKWGIKGKGNNPDDWPEAFPRQYPEAVA